MARMLEADYQSGGVLVDYLAKADRTIDSATAIAKRALTRPVAGHLTPTEKIADVRAATIMKRDPSVGYAHAIAQVFTSDPDLYRSYEIQKAGMDSSYGTAAGSGGMESAYREKARGGADGWDDAEGDDDEQCDPDDPECDDAMDKKRKRRLAPRRKHDYGPDDQLLWESGGKPEADATVAKRAPCPRCKNQVDVERVRKSHRCPACAASLTAL